MKQSKEGSLHKRILELSKYWRERQIHNWRDKTHVASDTGAFVANLSKVLEKAKTTFPFSKTLKWATPYEELKYWKQVSLSGQSQEVASWIKERIKTLEWFVEQFGT